MQLRVPILLLAQLGLLGSGLRAQGSERYNLAPILYGEAATQGPVERMRARLESGELVLSKDARLGYLPAVLVALEVPVASQILVFSKTSLQLDRIGPRTPRAIYFGDDVYVGWIPGSPVMEISSMDPDKGPVFYTLNAAGEAGARLERDRGECLACHAGSRTGYWPGNLVRSVQPDERGHPVLRLGTRTVGPATPLAERWGGWYVTGTHGSQRHLGNATTGPGGEPIDPGQGANVTDLAPYFRTAAYPSPHSDLVALMVHEHQVSMHNRIAQASYEVRLALARDADLRRLLDEPEDGLRPATVRVLERQAKLLLDELLFQREAPLAEPVQGSSDFAAVFSAAGLRDGEGRSLKDLDLETRLLRYPCSYLIYSPAFDALPAPLLEIVYRRLAAILNGAPAFDEYIRLTLPKRRSIRDILLATKPGLPAGFQGPPPKKTR